MNTQKEAILKLILEQKEKGRSVGEALGSLGVARSTYYRWKKSDAPQSDRVSGAYPLTPGREREDRGRERNAYAASASADSGDPAGGRDLSVLLSDLRVLKAEGSCGAICQKTFPMGGAPV